jgi:hypothetical protein
VPLVHQPVQARGEQPSRQRLWSQACASCTVTSPPSVGAAIACHRADAEDLHYGGYSDTGSPVAQATTWIWTGSWAAG